MSQYDILRRLLSDRPIAFHPQLARVLGGINEALFFQQIAYWSDKGSDPDWIYKSQAELEREICLSAYQQKQARDTLKRLGVLEDARRGVPARLYYRVLWNVVFRLLETGELDSDVRESSFAESRNLDSGIAATGFPESEKLDSQSSRDKKGSSSATISERTAESPDTEASNLRPLQMNVDKYDADRLDLLPYVQDLARELNDQARLSATVTRVVGLKKQSGVDLDRFLERVQQARAITQEQTAAIRTEGDGLRGKPKMAYFLAVLEDLLGE